MLTCIGASWTDVSKLRQPTKPTVLFADTLPTTSPRHRTIFINVEPEAILHTEQFMLENYDKFYAILTYNTNVLTACPNARKYIFGSSWIPQEKWGSARAKEFNVTGLFGTKALTNQGHPLRMYMYMRQKEITIPYKFFRSSRQVPHLPLLTDNPFIKDSKLPLFETSQFSIVIENSQQENYFTEKLLDCLLTKTIPIYYGCPNIGEFFDTKGWIVLPATDVINIAISAINQLTPDWYAAHQDTIDHNFKEAQKYVDWHTNLNRALEQLTDY